MDFVVKFVFYLILNSLKRDAECIEKPLAYFFGEKVSFVEFLKLLVTGKMAFQQPLATSMT